MVAGALACSLVCLLATELNFRATRNDTACGYCVEARSTHANCFDAVLDCAYRDPKGIIFCATLYETEPSEEFISRTLRCLSYYDLYIEDHEIEAITALGTCEYRNRMHCDCGNACPGRNVSNAGRPNFQTTTKKTRVRSTTPMSTKASSTPSPSYSTLPMHPVEGGEITFGERVSRFWYELTAKNEAPSAVSFLISLIALLPLALQ